MEQIQQFLDEDEEILWKREIIRNLSVERKYFTIFIISFLVAFSTIFTYFLYVFYLTFSVIFILLFISVSLLILPNIMIMIKILKKYKNSKKQVIEKYQLSLEELRNYHFLWVLTNKKWIQKDFTSDDKVKMDPAGIMQQKGDILQIDLKSIRIIEIKRNFREISFYISDDYYLAKSPNLSVEIHSKQDFKNLEQVIRDLIPIEKEDNRKKKVTLYT